jgi:hypothetical protein
VGPPAFSRSNRYHDFAFYGGDTWKAMHNLTIDLGLRWEYYGVQHNDHQELDSNLYYGTGATLVQKLQNAKVSTVPTSPTGNLWQPSWHNFGPRVGFAWDVFGDGKTSVRGGFGMSYERNFGNVTFNVIQNPPNYAVIALITGVDVGTNPITTSNVGPLAGTSGTKALPRTSLRYVRQDIKPAYTEFWSFGVQRELARNTVLAMDYNGAHGVHQYSIANFNKPGFGVLYGGTDPTINPVDRLNRGFTNINTRGSDGFNYYDGLNTRLSSDNLLHQGVNMTINYTYSHSIDNLSSTFSETAAALNLGQMDPFRPSVDKGDSDYDARHRLSLSAVWDLPYAKETHGWVKQVLDGWSLIPVWTAHTGFPFTIFDCSNEIDTTSCGRYIAATAMAKSGTTSGRDQGNNLFNYLGFSTLSSGINAYADPLVGAGELPSCPAPGSSPMQCNFPANMTHRNAFRGPGAWNFDFGIHKNFQVTERIGLQFRTEMFNAFNHSNYYVLSGGNADASALTSPLDPNIGFIQGKRGTNLSGITERRFIQFAAKVSF